LPIEGYTLHQALENAVSQYPKLEGRFPQVAGLQFAFDPSKQPGNRIDPNLIKIQDEYLEMDKVKPNLTFYFIFLYIIFLI
jgi:5'-nucleotidase